MNCPKNKWTLAAALWLAASVYGLIFRESTGSHAPPFPHFDKMAHALIFFVQIWLLCKAHLQANRAMPNRALLIFALIYAVLSEWAQAAFTLTRQADLWDGVADMLGASLALYLGNAVYAARKNRINTKI